MLEITLFILLKLKIMAFLEKSILLTMKAII